MKEDMQNRISEFVSKLQYKTENNQIEWHRLHDYERLQQLMYELPDTPGLYVDFYTNSVNQGKSYYLSTEKGTLFLLYVYHASGQMDGSYMMLVRLNHTTELVYFDFGEVFHRITQGKLESLASVIEDYLKNSERDMTKEFYDFLDDVLK